MKKNVKPPTQIFFDNQVSEAYCFEYFTMEDNTKRVFFLCVLVRLDRNEMFAWQKMIRPQGRTTWEQEAIQVPFQGQRQNKQEQQRQPEGPSLPTQSTLHIYSDIHIRIHAGKPSTAKNGAGRRCLMLTRLPFVQLFVLW